MISNRDRKIVITSQFNINGSRGKDAGKFVSDYISRDSAVDKAMSYHPDPNSVIRQGDGAAFTLDSNGVTREEVMRTAERVQDWHLTGKRAIQQMVISFDPDYLVKQNLVDPDLTVLHKGDYRYQYDDVRIRNGVRQGLQSLIDNEGYNDGQAIACIQWDTKHLHVHAIVYENAPRIARKRGYEEKGVIKQSSLNEMAHEIDRNLSLTKSDVLVPSQKNLIPEEVEAKPKAQIETAPIVKMPYVDRYLILLEQQRREKELSGKTQVALSRAEDILNQRIDQTDLARAEEIFNQKMDQTDVDKAEEILKQNMGQQNESDEQIQKGK